MTNSSNNLNRQTPQNQHNGQSQQQQQHQNQRENSVEKERPQGTITNGSNEGHNQYEKKQCENKENVNSTKQEHKRNYKNSKGFNRKWYSNHQRKFSNHNLVQQRDVNNYKPDLEEGRRTATSPLNVNVCETRGMKQIVLPKDSSMIKEKIDDVYSSQKYHHDLGKHSNRNSVSRNRQCRFLFLWRF